MTKRQQRRSAVQMAKKRLMKLSATDTFATDYFDARQRFRDAAGRLGWQLEVHPIDAAGPGGEELTIDVSISDAGDNERVLVLSSGVHGVEGFFGHAVQLAAMRRLMTTTRAPCKYVVLHAVNPFGFAWLRRFNEDNVDPNRNFLLSGEAFAGAPDGYSQLDSFLNPRRAPSHWEPFTLKAVLKILRHGMPTLRQAIAAGQYDYPKGLFFGGGRACQSQKILRQQLPRWLDGARRVMHLDFHTGLGSWGTSKLLIDYRLTDKQRGWFTKTYGPDSFEANCDSDIAYDARGGLGQWCVAQRLAEEYHFACAEFGTHGPVRVLAGLRSENQAHHWGTPDAATTAAAKVHLKELFCPSSEQWRTSVIARSIELISQAERGLMIS